MASPLKSGKQFVTLAAPVRGSRIRRDPPPVAKQVAVRDPEERETWAVVVGVVSFALAIVVITLAVSIGLGGSPSRQEPIHIDL
jgi:hypothetical protein